MRRGIIAAFCIALVLATSLAAAQVDPDSDSLLAVLHSGKVSDDAERYTLLCDIAYGSDNADTIMLYSRQAILLAERLDINPAMPYITMGKAYFIYGQASPAVECYLKAEEFYKDDGVKSGVAVAYLYIAEAYNTQDFFGTEQYYLNQAIDIFRESNDTMSLAVALHNLGYSFYKSGDYDQALVRFEETRPLFQKQGDQVSFARCTGNMGMVFARQKDFDKAAEYLQSAISLLNELEDPYPVAEFRIEFANLLLEQENIEEAIGYAMQSFKDAASYGYVEFERDAVKCLAELYQISGNPDSAYHYLSLFSSLNDSISIHNYNNVQQMTDLWADFLVAGKQAEVDLLEKKRIIQFVVIGGLAVILLLAVGFVVQYYVSLKRSRKLTASLEERGEMLESQGRELEKQKEELMQQKEELQVTLENLRKTQEQLVESEKMAAMGSLVAGVAHEMNTPVGVGITAVTNLRDEVSRMTTLYKEKKINGEELGNFLESADVIVRLIEKNLEKAAALIQSFTQISTDQVTEQQRVFACREYLNDIVISFRPKFSGKSIQVRIDCDEDLKLNSYPGVYAQIFTHLLSNSLQHGYYDRNKGTIEMKVEQEGAELKIRYSDDGKGINKKDLRHIFEPFFTSDQHRGTGLGLNIIYNLVKQKLRGSITVESEPGKGVTFYITVPNYT